MKWFLAILNSICLALIILLTAVQLPTFCKPFYEFEYGKYNIPVQLNMTDDDLMKVTDHMLRYMSGKEYDLSISAVVNGRTRDFFNDREKEHMADVRTLFLDGFTLRNIAIAFWFVTLLLMIALKCRPVRTLSLVYQIFLGCFMVLAGLTAFLISRDFNAAFTVFHHIFFNNNLWILDPSTDLLVNIVPEGFFVDIALIIGILFASFCLLVMLASAIVRMIIGPRKPVTASRELEG